MAVVDKGIQVAVVLDKKLVQDFGTQVMVYMEDCIGHTYKDYRSMAKASGNICENKTKKHILLE